MNARIFSLAITGLVGAVSLAPAATEPAKADASPAKTEANNAKPTLTKGMTGEEVLKCIGKPEEVKPLKAKDVKAEEWIYRRKAGSHYVDVPTGEREVPAYTGVGLGNDSIQTRTEMIYTKKRVTIYQVTTLLMIDDRFAAAKQKLEQSNTFE